MASRSVAKVRRSIIFRPCFRMIVCIDVPHKKTATGCGGFPVGRAFALPCYAARRTLVLGLRFRGGMIPARRFAAVPEML